MFERLKTGVMVGGASLVGVAASAVPAFAEGEAFVVSAADLAPVAQTITGNISVLIPVGVSILAIMVGVSLIPRIIYKFF